MCEIYDVFIGDQVIGKMTVTKRGLYYHFSCKCRLSGEVIYKIIVSCNDKRISLGVCVPEGNDFVLHTRLPIKQIGEGIFLFRAVPKHCEQTEGFVPIRPEEPFAYLGMLSKAYLAVQDNQIGVVINHSELTGSV